MKRSFWLLRGLKFLFFAGLFVVAVLLLTRYLWNELVPLLFHGPAISLGQTFGLLVLSRLLFGGWGGRGGGWAQKRRAWQQRMAGRMESLSPEAREKFRQQMQAKCGGMGWMRRPDAAAAPAAAQQPA
ncbi:hypothetical protein ACFQ48_10750 [Hymenobacter caeli]|uniref:DUF1682 domain-containing protein n=1 Tax=Hymenobacter caeli TaxID=2735894 RepID=A0ABX2FU15_9BACT|nr:hypothetical protein [Hymenobacter caeli]NRT19959.1 hypothetical protein [Hymenobacter caeli]